MPDTKVFSPTTIPRDLNAGLVVFFVALPLSLGVALSSNAPLFSGVLAGIIGGIVVGILSGSHTSVSGSSASLTAIIATQIASFGSFEAFLLAVVVAGLIQVGLGVVRAGSLSVFFPNSVVQGLLAAIGVILILKQIPHLLGHDTDPEGEMAFIQPDHENSLSELYAMLSDVHPGAAVIGLLSVALLLLSDRIPLCRRSPIPASLAVVFLGVGLSLLFQHGIGGVLSIQANHLVQVPVAKNLRDFWGFLRMPDFSQMFNPAVYMAGVTIAMVASLETLLNLEAVDKIDPKQRTSPPSRELIAQGIGNIIAGLIGGIPVSSVIVRSSVNIEAGGQTKLATVAHGILLIISVMFFPQWLNLIPLSCLAAILLVTGFKLASVTLIRRMWNDGRYQFAPFLLTVVAIVLTDLLIGVALGLVISLAFILSSNLRRPLHRIVERHLGGDVLRIELANQVSFLNRAALDKVFNSIPRGGNILLDASNTVYIDPDVLSMIREFREKTAPARAVKVSLRGFKDKYALKDEIQYVDYSTRDLQQLMTSAQVLQILQEGNERFRSGKRLTRDLTRQLQATAQGQHPLAVVLSCIDSRTPSELIFDLGLGDIFSIRIAGNIISPKVLGSMEYGCAVAGAKLLIVIGHTQCGAVTAAVNLAGSRQTAEEATGCQHLEPIIQEIQRAIAPGSNLNLDGCAEDKKVEFVNAVATRNVEHTVRSILEQSRTIHRLVETRQIVVIGAMYDVVTGQITFFSDQGDCSLS